MSWRDKSGSLLVDALECRKVKERAGEETDGDCDNEWQKLARRERVDE